MKTADINQTRLLSCVKQLGLVDGWRQWQLRRLCCKANRSIHRIAQQYREHAFYLEKRGLPDEAHRLLNLASQLEQQLND
jgi:hypothetical protein